MGTAALTPLERQSVWRTLKSVRLLKTELLAGLVVSLALIPEVIAFTVIAGVDPRVGIFASFSRTRTVRSCTSLASELTGQQAGRHAGT